MGEKKISLANKYRPLKFEDVVEQDTIKTVLLNQMQTDNLKHAYLFCGSAGTREDHQCQNYSWYDE